MTKKGRRQKLQNDEYDVVTGWRKLLCLARGTRKKVKGRLNRRERRQTNEQMKNNAYDNDKF